ncbi:MAG: hypothetical protein JSW11_11995 [Candidatus Heimdallarchaeota archaeon]|nr:MAG: hypothetical protein JSW11_11995 [Candidatus Heimdallarchaeota archaeon]
MQIILFAIPYIVTLIVAYVLIFIGGRYIFSKINSLFGIDFTGEQQKQDLSTPLISPLFTEKGFHAFQTYALQRLNKRWITYGAFFLVVLLEFIGIWGPFLFFQVDEWVQNFPELTENGLYYAYLVFRVGPLSLFLFWFLFCVSALIFLIIEVMIIFNALGNFSGLSLNKISEYLDSSVENESPDVFSQKSEFVQFSLTNFRRKCKIIPQMFLKINIGISIGTVILVLMASIYISNILEEEVRTFAISSFFPMIPGIMLLNLAVFIFPQYSLHRHLERIKKAFLDYISHFADLRSGQYLNFTFTDNLEEGKERQLLLSELQTLNQIIEQAEGFSTWPFDYNHVTTLLIGLILPFATLIIEILFIL